MKDRVNMSSQKGQVLLIVILVMVVALTIGLSVASRSITNLKISTEQAESQKALAAAEAGIEQAIKANQAPAPGSLGNATYTTTLNKVNGTQFVLNGGNPISKNDGFDLWLSDYSSDSAKIYLNQTSPDLTIYWSESTDDCSSSALEIVVVSGVRANPTVTKYAVDPCASRRAVNRFAASAAGGIIDGRTFFFSYAVPHITNGFFVRVIPLYTNSTAAVSSSVSLPDQGNNIESTGNAGSTERKVTVFQAYPGLPSELFPYTLFSP